MKRLIIAAIFCMAPLLAFGDQATGKSKDNVKKNMLLEAFGNYQFTSFDAGSIDTGSGHGMDTGLRVFPKNGRWGVGFRLGRFSHDVRYDHPLPIEGPDAISVDGNGWTAAGDIYLRSRRKHVQPYVFFGLGAISEDHTYHFQSGNTLPKQVRTAAVDLGCGLRIAVANRWFITPEVRVLFGLPEVNYAAQQFGIGITYVIRK